MKASDVMTGRVITISADATIKEAIRLMLQNHISGLPVVDTGRLVGMVTEGDFMRRAEVATQRHRPRWLEFMLSPGRLADEYVATHSRKVSDVMTRDVVSVEEDRPLEDIVELMEKHRIKRVPVVRSARIVGIISRANLLHALAGLAAKAEPPNLGDTLIRSRLLDELERPGWVPRGSLNITVENGIVHLWGAIFDNRERDALRVAAENIPGVKKVRDHMSWIDPASGMVIDASPDAGYKASAADVRTAATAG